MNDREIKSIKSSGKVVSRTEAQRKRSIAIMVVLAAIFIGTVLLYFILQGIVAYLEGREEPEDERNQSIIFYEADFDKNIFEDEAYLDLDRIIYHCDPSTGITTSLTPETLEEISSSEREYVAVIVDFINYAINGDWQNLNKLFSDEYIAVGAPVKNEFTMQMLYNIKITYIANSTDIVDGEREESYDYWLEYMIRHNNGTFRSDMGSDCTRKEYVRITCRDGEYRIDVLDPIKTN